MTLLVILAESATASPQYLRQITHNIHCISIESLVYDFEIKLFFSIHYYSYVNVSYGCNVMTKPDL